MIEFLSAKQIFTEIYIDPLLQRPEFTLSPNHKGARIMYSESGTFETQRNSTKHYSTLVLPTFYLQARGSTSHAASLGFDYKLEDRCGALLYNAAKRKKVDLSKSVPPAITHFLEYDGRRIYINYDPKDYVFVKMSELSHIQQFSRQMVEQQIGLSILDCDKVTLLL